MSKVNAFFQPLKYEDLLLFLFYKYLWVLDSTFFIFGRLNK